MKRIHLLFLFSFIFLLCSSAVSGAAGIVDDDAMRTAAFWQKNTPNSNDIIMDTAQINSFNQKLRQNSSCLVDLTVYPLKKIRAEVKNIIISSSVLPDEAYDDNGQPFDEDSRNNLYDNMNLAALSDEVNIKMGVTVHRANIRTLPSPEPLFEQPYPSDFDILQETAVDPSEAVLILAKSSDNDYYYVQTYNYSGWLAAQDVALTDNREEWLKFAQPQKFLVVTGQSYEINDTNDALFYQMGSRILFTEKYNTGYKIIVPHRDNAGNLIEKEQIIAADTALHEGYLPYTRSNLIAEAFQYLDAPYGWGGLKDSVDCSSFIADIYRTVGIFLPRNADQQEEASGMHFPFDNFSEADTYASILKNCQPGDALFMDGHVMFYLGSVNNTPYIIHALGSYTDDNGKHHIMRVVVSDLSLTLASGNTFAAALTSAEDFQ